MAEQDAFDLVLGSQSSGRRSCLSKAGYEYTTLVADIDEKAVQVGGGENREQSDPKQVEQQVKWQHMLLTYPDAADCRHCQRQSTSAHPAARGEASQAAETHPAYYQRYVPALHCLYTCSSTCVLPPILSLSSVSLLTWLVRRSSCTL